jgi:hypothetical protein
MDRCQECGYGLDFDEGHSELHCVKNQMQSKLDIILDFARENLEAAEPNSKVATAMQWLIEG